MEHLSTLAVWRGPRGGSSFTVDPGRDAKKVTGYRHLSQWGPLFIQGDPGMWGGAHILETLIDK